MSFEFVPVWNKVTPEIEAELAEFWIKNKAMLKETRASERAKQVVCVARSEQGEIAGASTVYPCIVPLLRQPMYYYRTYIAPAYRGKGLMIPLLQESKKALQEYNLALPKPQCLGIMIELENKRLAATFSAAHWPRTDFTFIGYSVHGLPLRVWYFEGVRLFAPHSLTKAETVGGG
ncbi:MAG: hypothetical protein WC213_12050 [Arenimonas sp.]|jgi:hypothetical protein